MTLTKKPVIIITGPTASGKTRFAVQLAKAIDGEIISADSRQIFRDMDLGTGKDLDEYEGVPYHLIDILEAGEEFSVSEYQTLALQALESIHSRGKVPVICGGTGYYLKALIEDYQFDSPATDLEYTLSLEQKSYEELYERLKELNLEEQHDWASDSKRRMARAIEKAERETKNLSGEHAFSDCYQSRIYYTHPERPLIRKKIRVRLEQRLNTGMIEEVLALNSNGVSWDRLDRYGLEYKWVGKYLREEINRKEMTEKLHTEICRFAKRQMTFIRYLQKSGHPMIAFQTTQFLVQDVKHWLNQAAS